MTPEQQLMEKVKTTCGPWIDEAAAGTPYTPAFLAALTANESGGDVGVQRFESKVFGELCFVLLGRKANFGAIGGEDIANYLRETLPGASIPPLDLGLGALVSLATSYGPTQIMGYQALAGRYDLAELPNLQKHYPHAIAMLEDFRRRFNLTIAGGGDVAAYWGKFFHCWNAGSPAAPTFDPQYAAKGLDRMTIYNLL